jgi:ADP-heptose:LPS heptosyltransferase
MTLRGNSLLRRADRLVGVPLVLLLGLLRRRRRPSSRPARVGLLKTSAIGDSVLLSAIVADLRRGLPDARLVFFSGADNAGLLSAVDGLDERVTVPVGSPLRAIRELRRHRVDVLLDFGSWPRIDAVLAACSGSGCTVGFRTRGQRRHYAHDVVVEHSASVHELENYRRLLDAIGVETGSTPRLRPPATWAVDSLPRPYAVLHLFAGGYRSELREWADERWHELASELDARGYGVVLTGAEHERERAAAFAAASPLADGRLVDLAGRLSLADVLDVVAASELVVSVNTGLMHIAAALGVPTVSLNGPTAERRWGPVGAACVSVNSRYEGCGFLDLGGEYRGRREDCMDGIPVADVLAAVDGLVRAREAV